MWLFISASSMGICRYPCAKLKEVSHLQNCTSCNASSMHGKENTPQTLLNSVSRRQHRFKIHQCFFLPSYPITKQKSLIMERENFLIFIHPIQESMLLLLTKWDIATVEFEGQPLYLIIQTLVVTCIWMRSKS